ncbi:uncharacterized protein LOC130897748 [Diorhabda carinulata]|uniref:uncharacterized protein LOC130897748 n=1 Tax=Diorhabda carinulata TaxID=1163345 RepID=UPI00259FEF54|nr:uncharacterized protein LOC130897748 [Diorhabda carinulata]
MTENCENNINLEIYVKHFAPNADRSSQLSPQQQGQILSDIQQHQHRFDLPRNQQQFEPQHFQTNQNFQSTKTLQTFLNQQQFVSQSPLQLNTQESFAQNEFLNNLPLLKSIPTNVVPTPQQAYQQISPPTNQVIFPDQKPSERTKVIQHHTQTSFQPARQSLPLGPQFIQPRPTTDPISLIEQQIKSLDPEKHKQKIKELREKQAIIEKHAQFVEKQYEKALKKAQEEHQAFIDRQRNQKKQLYQKLYKTSAETVSLPQTAPRLLYPEEISLFEQAVKQYYDEHPTTTSSPSTSSTISPTFLPTALPQSKVKSIQTLEDLNQLKNEYKSQKIRKDDLLEQLRLAIGRRQEDESEKTLSSREISSSKAKTNQLNSPGDQANASKGKEDGNVLLPSGHQVNIFGTTTIPKEITLPNGQKAQLIASTTQPTPIEEIILPNGEKVELIKTSDPSLVPDGVKVEPGSDLEKLVFSRTTTTTETPPKAILDELTKTVPSSNYELLKTGASGSLESIGKNLPDEKKVTFVLLEEQSDGTLKIQGVKGNDKDKPVDVDAILNKIRKGEIKLPNNPNISTTTHTPDIISSTLRNDFTTLGEIRATITPNSFATEEPRFVSTISEYNEEETGIPSLKTNIGFIKSSV